MKPILDETNRSCVKKKEEERQTEMDVESKERDESSAERDHGGSATFQ